MQEDLHEEDTEHGAGREEEQEAGETSGRGAGPIDRQGGGPESGPLPREGVRRSTRDQRDGGRSGDSRLPPVTPRVVPRRGGEEEARDVMHKRLPHAEARRDHQGLAPRGKSDGDASAPRHRGPASESVGPRLPADRRHEHRGRPRHLAHQGVQRDRGVQGDGGDGGCHAATRLQDVEECHSRLVEVENRRRKRKRFDFDDFVTCSSSRMGIRIKILGEL